MPKSRTVPGGKPRTTAIKRTVLQFIDAPASAVNVTIKGAGGVVLIKLLEELKPEVWEKMKAALVEAKLVDVVDGAPAVRWFIDPLIAFMNERRETRRGAAKKEGAA